MTREQAINVLQKYTDTDSGISEVVAEAHKMAIKALEQEQEDVEDDVPDIPYETGTIICDSCGSEIAFCPYCGAEMGGAE